MRTIIFVFLLAIGTSLLAQTSDPAPQIVNGPVVENVSDSAATVAWSTNVSAGTAVRYGTKPDQFDHIKQAPWGGYTHRVTLNGLQPDTKYYYIVESLHAQGSGAGARSAVAEFTTKGHGSTAGGAASKLAITKGPHNEKTTESSAVISWTTNANSSTVAKYGTDAQKLGEQAQQPWGGTIHRVELKGLQPDTTYYYQVQSAQGEGTTGEAESAVQHFKTPAKKP